MFDATLTRERHALPFFVALSQLPVENHSYIDIDKVAHADSP